MLFKDGKLAGQKVGAAPKGDLSKWIQQATASGMELELFHGRTDERLDMSPSPIGSGVTSSALSDDLASYLRMRRTELKHCLHGG